VSAICTYLGNVLFPSPLLDEIENVTEEELIELGVDVFEPDLEGTVEAEATSNKSRLSFHDALCLHTAERLQAICVTNDKLLMDACEKRSVNSIRGLRLILDLHESGGISTLKAKRTAVRIHENNPNYISDKLLEDFLKELEK
jgi:hypothetical protein